MTTSPITLQDLSRKMYLKAKADPAWRFRGLYVHVCKKEVVNHAYETAKAKEGAPGIDGMTFDDIEAAGRDTLLKQIRDELVSGTYTPQRNRRTSIPKGGGKTRVISIPTVRDRVVQGALKLVLEPIFEADFQPGSFGYRSHRSAHAAINRVAIAIREGKTHVLNLDLQTYFDRIRHHRLLQLIATRVDDDRVMRLLKRMLVVNGRMGAPQGGVISPLLSNVYLTGIDRMLEQLKEDSRHGRYTTLEYVRYADNLVVLVDGHPRHDRLIQAVNDRVRQQLATLDVEVNEEKTRLVDLTKEEGFEFLGFEFRQTRSHTGRWRPHYTPTVKKQMKLRQKLTNIVEHMRDRTPAHIVEKINPILRGWVTYFAIGHSDRCFGQIRALTERIVWREVLGNQVRNERMSAERREWMYSTFGLFSDYRTRYYTPPSSLVGRATRVW